MMVELRGDVKHIRENQQLYLQQITRRIDDQGEQVDELIVFKAQHEGASAQQAVSVGIIAFVVSSLIGALAIFWRG
jgi:hypothetical protein